MPNVARQKILRVLDANFNRAKEGLRVCEDVFRFVYDRPALTAEYKQARHRLTAATASLNFGKVIASRDITGDVGRATSPAELQRSSVKDIYYANSQRAKESVRVLEEFAKLIDEDLAKRFKKIRYQLYETERKVVKIL